MIIDWVLVGACATVIAAVFAGWSWWRTVLSAKDSARMHEEIIAIYDKIANSLDQANELNDKAATHSKEANLILEKANEHYAESNELQKKQLEHQKKALANEAYFKSIENISNDLNQLLNDLIFYHDVIDRSYRKIEKTISPRLELRGSMDMGHSELDEYLKAARNIRSLTDKFSKKHSDQDLTAIFEPPSPFIQCLDEVTGLLEKNISGRFTGGQQLPFMKQFEQQQKSLNAAFDDVLKELRKFCEKILSHETD